MKRVGVTSRAVALATAALLAACSTAGPIANPSPSASAAPSDTPSVDKGFYDALVAARTLSESGWAAYTVEQAKCLPLKHQRGNLESFTACYPSYTAAFHDVVTLNEDYAGYLESVDAPEPIAPTFAAYRDAVVAATMRLAAMYEVFCTETPHSDVEWYNCVGSNDVSEYWERYFQLRNAVDQTADDLSVAFAELGLPPLTTS